MFVPPWECFTIQKHEKKLIYDRLPMKSMKYNSTFNVQHSTNEIQGIRIISSVPHSQFHNYLK